MASFKRALIRDLRTSYANKTARTRRAYAMVQKPARMSTIARFRSRIPVFRFRPGAGLELKYVDFIAASSTATIALASATVQNASLSTTGFIPCNLIEQGSANFNREGSMVFGKRLHVCADFVAGSSAETSDAIVRCCIVQDTAPNLSNVTLGEIFQDTDQSGGTVNTDFNSGINSDKYYRFKLLYNRVLVVSKVAGPSPFQHLDVDLTLPSTPSRFIASAGAVTFAHILSNAYYFIFFSQMSGAGTLPKVANVTVRYTFAESK